MTMPNTLRDSPLNQNQTLKSGYNYYTRILKNKILGILRRNQVNYEAYNLSFNYINESRNMLSCLCVCKWSC